MAEPRARKSLFQRPDVLLVDEPPLIQMPLSAPAPLEPEDASEEDGLIPAIEEGDDAREPARVFLGVPGGSAGALSQSPGSMLPEAVSQLEEILGSGPPRVHRPRRDNPDDLLPRAERTNPAIRIPRMEPTGRSDMGRGAGVDVLGEPMPMRERTNPALRVPRVDDLEAFAPRERTNPALRMPVVDDGFESYTANRGNHAHKGRELVDAMVEMPLGDESLFGDTRRGKRAGGENRPALGMKLELKRPGVELEARAEVKADLRSEIKPEARPEVKPETKPEARREIKPEARPEVKPAEPPAEPKDASSTAPPGTRPPRKTLSALASFDDMTAPPIPWTPSPSLPPVVPVSRDRPTPGPERRAQPRPEPRSGLDLAKRAPDLEPTAPNVPERTGEFDLGKVMAARPDARPAAPREADRSKPVKSIDLRSAEKTFNNIPRNVSRSENRTLEQKLEQLEAAERAKQGDRRAEDRREEKRAEVKAPSSLTRADFPPLPSPNPVLVTTGKHRVPPQEEPPGLPLGLAALVLVLGLAVGGLLWMIVPGPTPGGVAAPSTPQAPVQVADAGVPPAPLPPEPVPQTGILQVWADQKAKVWVDGGYKGEVEGRGGDAGPQSGPSNLSPVELSPGPHTVKAQATNGRVRVFNVRIDEGRRTDLVIRFNR